MKLITRLITPSQARYFPSRPVPHRGVPGRVLGGAVENTRYGKWNLETRATRLQGGGPIRWQFPRPSLSRFL